MRDKFTAVACTWPKLFHAQSKNTRKPRGILLHGCRLHTFPSTQRTNSYLHEHRVGRPGKSIRQTYLQTFSFLCFQPTDVFTRPRKLIGTRYPGVAWNEKERKYYECQTYNLIFIRIFFLSNFEFTGKGLSSKDL